MRKLSDELAILKNKWVSGERDPDTARKLLFVGWYVFVEPDFVTGIDTTLYAKQSTRIGPNGKPYSVHAYDGCMGGTPDIQKILDELLLIVEDSANTDLESALVLGYMASFSPYVFGSEDVWFRKAQSLLENAYKIAEEQNRKKNELSQIGYQLAPKQVYSKKRLLI
jgi:hypothetical protein